MTTTLRNDNNNDNQAFMDAIGATVGAVTRTTAAQQDDATLCPTAWLGSLLETWLVFPHDGHVWGHILAYLTLDDIVWGVRHVNSPIRRATRAAALSNCGTAWHGSFLRRRLVKSSKHAVNNCLDSTLLGGPSAVDEVNDNTIRHLVYLDMSGLIHWTGRTVQGFSLLQHVCRANPHLQTLNCSDCHRLEAQCLVEAWRSDNHNHNSPNLRHLYLTNCYRVNADVINSILEHPTMRLRTLHVGGCAADIGKRSTLLVGDHHGASRDASQHLQSLDISGQSHLVGNLQSLALLPQLREFVSAACDKFDLSHPVLSVSTALMQQRMTDMEISLDGNDSSSSVKDALRQFSNEIFSNDLRLSLVSFSHLERINFNDRPPRLRSPSALAWIALQSCRLVEVHLRGYESITNFDIQILAVTCGDTLRVADWQGLPLLEDGGMQSVGRYCHALVDLDISVCFALSDVGVSCVATKCRKLRCLRMNHVNVTDLSLQTVSLHLQDLLVLSIQGCGRLQHLDRLPPKLIELDARETNLRVDKRILPRTLKFKDGRQQRETVVTAGYRPQCSFARQSRRFFVPGDLSLQPMWSCLDCNLVPDRGICGVCSIHCHADHHVYLVGLCKFYCDCAIGLGRTACQCVSPYGRLAEQD